MAVRIANKDDFDLVLRMAKDFIKVSKYEQYIDEEEVKKVINKLLEDQGKGSICILYDDIGMIGGMASKFIFGTDWATTELVWWVDPEHRKAKVGSELKKAFEAWSRTIGCKINIMVTQDDAVGSVLEKDGYVLCERTYLREV